MNIFFIINVYELIIQNNLFITIFFPKNTEIIPKLLRSYRQWWRI